MPYKYTLYITYTIHKDRIVERAREIVIDREFDIYVVAYSDILK